MFPKGHPLKGIAPWIDITEDLESWTLVIPSPIIYGSGKVIQSNLKVSTMRSPSSSHATRGNCCLQFGYDHSPLPHFFAFPPPFPPFFFFFPPSHRSSTFDPFSISFFDSVKIPSLNLPIPPPKPLSLESLLPRLSFLPPIFLPASPRPPIPRTHEPAALASTLAFSVRAERADTMAV